MYILQHYTTVAMFVLCVKMSSMNISKTEYNRVHKYMLRHYEKTGVCDFCKQTRKTQWANKDDAYNEKDRNNWHELCVKCHMNYDWGRKTKKSQLCSQCKKNRYIITKKLVGHKGWLKNFKLCMECYFNELAVLDIKIPNSTITKNAYTRLQKLLDEQ